MPDNLQLNRRFWLFVHEIVVHPVIGIAKVFSPTTKPLWANLIHDWTVPPLAKDDAEWLANARENDFVNQVD